MGRLLEQDADAYEPFTREAPLPSNRNREVPPDKYLVPYCVRENEGDGRFACPHLGCDGLSFSTPRECHAHEDRYHSGPFRCGTCERLFAAQSALERHCAENGHEIWVCGLKGCESEGSRFDTKDDFDMHVESSWAHTRELGLEEGVELAGGEGDTLSECVGFGEMCLAQACHKFHKIFTSVSDWKRHVSSLGHVKAIDLLESLSALNLSDESLAAKAEAARGHRCDQPGCPRYGMAMSTAQVYFKHIETEGHRDPEGFQAKEAARRTRVTCDEPECAGFGRKYTPLAFAKHVENGNHVKAVRLGEALRQLALLPPSTPGPAGECAMRRTSVVGLVTPGTSPTEGMSFPPASPTGVVTPSRRIVLRRGSQSGGRHPVTPVSPGFGVSWPSRSEREIWLEKRNRELEAEVEELKVVVRGMFWG